ncbi:Zinc transporter zip1-like [Plakobranchus ocellatus]|uniref:Zinc transporter zip1-like n=1 Tax=Plakobranchus ocellatus TaxID=259542 RepID=A0AAV4CYB8_9GAST|nr:Zinc transporter zip1-like [Plakobranchus ocellatus]
MDAVELKILSGIVMFILALFFGSAPFLFFIRFAKSEKNKTPHPLIKYLYALASGVLLATCLLHLLPESLRAVYDVIGDASGGNDWLINCNTTLIAEGSGGNSIINNDGLYPVAELMVALGFLFIYSVDIMFRTWQTFGKHNSGDETALSSASECRREGCTSGNESSLEDSLSDRARSMQDLDTRETSFLSENGSLNCNQRNYGTDVDVSEDESLHQISSQQCLSHSEENHLLNVAGQSSRLATGKQSSNVRSMALVAALCIHGFFDGVMLGLQTSERVLLSLLIALSLHKSFVSISLSLTLFNNFQPESEKKFNFVAAEVLYVFLFASVAPLGLALSSAFVHTTFDLSRENGAKDNSNSNVSVIPGCLQAFSVGTFMYVTFSEIADLSQQSKTHSSDSRRKALVRVLISHIFLVMGFVFMAWLRAAVGDS